MPKQGEVGEHGQQCKRPDVHVPTIKCGIVEKIGAEGDEQDGPAGEVVGEIAPQYFPQEKQAEDGHERPAHLHGDLVGEREAICREIGEAGDGVGDEEKWQIKQCHARRIFHYEVAVFGGEGLVAAEPVFFEEAGEEGQFFQISINDGGGQVEVVPAHVPCDGGLCAGAVPPGEEKHGVQNGGGGEEEGSAGVHDGSGFVG